MSKHKKTLTIDSPELVAHATEIRRLGKQTVDNVIEIGARLTKCKELVGHGEWLPWLKREFAWAEQTARNFMRVFELSKSTTVVDLSLPLSSLYLLTSPSTPEAARKEIIARAEKGEKLKVEDIKGAIHATRPAKKQTQPKKSTLPDCSQSGVSQVSTAPEKLTSGLPTGSDSSKNPVSQAESTACLCPNCMCGGVPSQTQPNPILEAFNASTVEQRQEFIEGHGDFIADWNAIASSRKKDAPLKYRIWSSCTEIEMGIDGEFEKGYWLEEYESIADQLSKLEQAINEAEAEDEEEDAEEDADLDIPDYLKRAAP